MNKNTNINQQIFWSRKMIETFIQIYKENECLYDMSHQNYSNDRVKSEALLNILQKMKQYLPHLELADVKDKLHSIRTQFATEISLIDDAESSGNKHIPSLWCFAQLEFLRKHMASSTSDNDLKEEDPLPEDSNEDLESDDSDVSLFTESNRKPKIKRRFRWSKEHLKFFIQFIKRHPILYDRTCKNYTNRDLKFMEYNKLLKEVKTLDRSITLDDIREKMRCLRKQFMKEVRLLKKANENNDFYDPKLWCFKRLADLYRNEIEIATYYNNVIKIDENSTSPVQEFEETIIKDNNETIEFEHIHQISDDHEGYVIETVTVPATANDNLEDSALNDIESDLEDQQPTKRWCTYKHYTNSAIIDFVEEKNNTSLSNNKTIQENYKCSKNTNEDNKYEWLGNLVVSQLTEIAPRLHNDFAWDVQCLIRKYVLKTKTNKNKTSSSQTTAFTTDFNDQQKSNESHDVILPKNSNISFNISFV